jgi:hypothetical protein
MSKASRQSLTRRSFARSLSVSESSRDTAFSNVSPDSGFPLVVLSDDVKPGRFVIRELQYFGWCASDSVCVRARGVRVCMRVDARVCLREIDVDRPCFSPHNFMQVFFFRRRLLDAHAAVDRFRSRMAAVLARSCSRLRYLWWLALSVSYPALCFEKRLVRCCIGVRPGTVDQC